MGLDVSLMKKFRNSYKYVDTIPSTKYPEHYFKLTYFRSSYNGSGINNVFRTRYNNDGLYYIFQFTQDDEVKDYFIPNWKESLKRANFCINLIKEDPIKDFEINDEMIDFKEINGATILEIFKEKYFEHVTAKRGFGAESDFIDGDGVWTFSNSAPVYAMVGGKKFGRDVVYTITKPSKPPLDWYVQALEIVIDGINYILDQKDSEKYAYSWSA